MARALSTIAELVQSSPDQIDWASLRYEHTQAIRARLMESHAPAGVRKILSAVRGTLREAWRLGQVNAEPRLFVS